MRLTWPIVLLTAGGIGLSVACGLLPGGSSGSAASANATVPVLRETFTVSVKARGELESEQASPIAVPKVPTGALKVKELAPEGTMVEEGQVIVVFDDSQLNIEMANHTASFRSSNRRIDKTNIEQGMEAGSVLTDRQVAEMEQAWAAEFQLEDEDIYSKLEILGAALDKSTAEERIIFADAKLLLRGEYYDIDKSILDVEKGQAVGKLERVQTSLGQLVLTAPIGGMVVYRKNWRGAMVTVGDTLWPGNIVMSIVDPTRTSLKVNIFEKDAAGVAENSPTQVRIDAFPATSFDGTVRSISKLSRPIEQGSPVKYFEAVVALEHGDAKRLKPGMKGEAVILVKELADAVVVPRAAVRGAEEETHVLVSSEAGIRMQRVSLGEGDQVRVSIVSGLQGGERILVGARPDGNLLPGDDLPPVDGEEKAADDPAPTAGDETVAVETPGAS
jgi:HlyD family secretion protein